MKCTPHMRKLNLGHKGCDKCGQILAGTSRTRTRKIVHNNICYRQESTLTVKVKFSMCRDPRRWVTELQWTSGCEIRQ